MSRLYPVLLALALPAASAAAVIEVTTLNDSAVGHPRHCSLRDALTASAQAQPVHGCPAGGAFLQDDIRFRPGLVGSIELHAPLLIASSVRIQGPAASRIQLRGAELRVQPHPRAQVEISGLNLQLPVRTGSLRSLVLHGVQMDGGIAALTTLPGAVIDHVMIVDSRFEGHLGTSAALQLGPQASVKHLSIRGSRFAQHRGDGGAAAVVVDAGAAEVRIEDSDFVANHAQAGQAGALLLNEVASAQIHRSILVGNRSPWAGALDVQALGPVRIVNSVWMGNQGGAAAALFSRGPGPVDLIHSSLIDNIGETPLLQGWGAMIGLRANLVRHAGGATCAGPVVSFGYNVLAGADTGNCGQGGDLFVGHLALQPVALPHRPLVLMPVAGSPALDLLPGDACGEGDWSNPVDLRGAPRPVHPQDPWEPTPRCDAGALERQPGE